ncbi:MAG: hypothetical protein NT027_12895 [Proteobacteria bacterium]|nr:hypothetical protein [Pseudomonadota bacterium]
MIRQVQISDLWNIMRLYQVNGSTMMPDELFTDYERLKEAFLNPSSYWLLSESDDKIVCLFALLIDADLGLSKLSRIMIDPNIADITEFVSYSLKSLLDHIREEFPTLELVYTTTFTLPMAFQKMTLKHSFKVLGVFPNAQGVDEYNLNGMSVAYLKESGLQQRDQNLRIHPTTQPFFDLAKKNVCLPDLPAIENPKIEKHLSPIFCELPIMEAIYAPEFVKRRFELLKANRSQIVNFYPFYWPNCVVTDPTGKVEIFLRVIEKTRFAAIIGEHIRIPVDPVQMFHSVFTILRRRNINYVELINDAGDVEGSDAIIRSGFTPCGYIPAFKKQGERRRDYVIYGKAFEFFCRLDLDIIPKEYLEFYKQYLKQEQRNYFKGLNFELNWVNPTSTNEADQYKNET